jgi:hypothetical protein
VPAGAASGVQVEPVADPAGTQLLASLVRRRGRNPRPRPMDLQIAATAARHGLALLTRNASDFTGLEPALAVVDLSGRP